MPRPLPFLERRGGGLCAATLVQRVQVEPADEEATGDIDKRAQEGKEGLGGGIDKQQRPAIAQALQGEALLAALEVAGQGAVGKAAAAIVGEALDHAAAEIKRAKA